MNRREFIAGMGAAAVVGAAQLSADPEGGLLTLERLAQQHFKGAHVAACARHAPAGKRLRDPYVMVHELWGPTGRDWTESQAEAIAELLAGQAALMGLVPGEVTVVGRVEQHPRRQPTIRTPCAAPACPGQGWVEVFRLRRMDGKTLG